MSALDDLDRAIAAEHDRARIDQYLDARLILAQPNPYPEDKRHALAILHTARTATGGTP